MLPRSWWPTGGPWQPFEGAAAITPAASSRLSTALLEARRTNSPKSKSEAKPQVIMGEIRNGLPAEPSVPATLELALQRLSEGVFGKPRGG